ncbi:MAG TPA: YicC family protein [Eubacteriaceae bacterium]|jgi:uncharacterized protein (TIGR00255 family)|nr:YicC family protein [Eubacteriaceae bacterium]
MKSMTGFGKGEYKDEDIEISVELKTINHRYKDFFVRMPRQISFAEDLVRKEIGEVISRGRIEVNIKINAYNMSNRNIKLNMELAQAYMNCLKDLKTSIPEITGEYSLSLVSRFPDVIFSEESEEDADVLWNKIKSALSSALTSVVESRMKEGQSLKKDFQKRLALIEDDIGKIKDLEASVVDEYREKLEQRIKDYTKDIELDQARLLTEVAYYSEKANITEETIRLKSHINRFKKILDEDEPVGRKLDFLIQEMHREINTIGSKSNHIEISNLVVDVKSEIEKMREQIQNIE